MRHTLFCVLILASACKKEEKSAPEAAKPAEAAKPTEVAVAPPAAKTGVTLTAGEAKFGCLAWSEATKSAACITGETGSTETEFSLAVIGPDASKMSLGEKIDDAMIANAKNVPGDYQPFAQPATALAKGTPVDVGGGVSLRHQVTAKEPGGNNVAPTEKHQVLAICGTTPTTVYETDEEGRQLTVAWRKVSAGTLVEITTNLGREGEYSNGFEAKLVDPSCKLL